MKWILRIVSAFGGLILLAILALFVLSQRSDAGKMHQTVEIQTTPDRLFPWLEDGEHAKKWVSWLVETKPAGGARNGVGSKEIWVMKDPNMANQLIPIEGTCTEYNPPSRLAVRLASEAFTGDQSYTLTNLGSNKTRLDVDSSYTFPGWFPRLMMPLIMPAAKQKMEGDLAKLKSLVEAAS